MGLQLAYTDPHGAAHASAYWHIIDFQVNRREQKITVLSAVYADKSARDAGKEPYAFQQLHEITGSDYTTVLGNMNGSNGAMKSLYNHIKALDEFDGASDVDPDA